MGNSQVRTQTKEYYNKSGEIHVSEMGGLMGYYQWWPTPPKYINETESGKWFCDIHGIPRDGDWCRVGDLSHRIPKNLFADVYDYYIKIEN